MNRPIKQIKVGSIILALFENINPKTNETISNITINRMYKPANGNKWLFAPNFRENEKQSDLRNVLTAIERFFKNDWDTNNEHNETKE
jgi:hypothetical protein